MEPKPELSTIPEMKAWIAERYPSAAIIECHVSEFGLGNSSEGECFAKVYDVDQVYVYAYGDTPTLALQRCVQQIMRQLMESCNCNYGGIGPEGFEKQPCTKCDNLRQIMEMRK
jgi:hypothetical protein